MVPPYSASLQRLRHPMFESVSFLMMFVFLFVTIVIVFAPLLLPPLGSLVSSSPHQLDIEMLVCFFELYVAALFFCFVLFCLVLFFLVLRLVLSCRPSVGPSPRHIIGLIPPANSNLFPPGLACALRACMKFLFRFSFLSFLCLFLFCPFLPFFTRLCITVLSSPLVPVYACTTAMFLVYYRSK